MEIYIGVGHLPSIQETNCLQDTLQSNIPPEVLPLEVTYCNISWFK
jgi:hypothetical protein